MSKPPKINVTTNYRLFQRHEDNRPLDLKRHRALEVSMQENGFIPDFHIICVRNAKGLLFVKDGQHRLATAEKLGLPVYWTETASDFDIAKVNNTQKTWHPSDYARRYAEAGNKEYIELLEFKEEHGIPITLAVALLSGTVAFSGAAQKFYDGEFTISDRPWAKAVVGVHGPLTKIEPQLKNKCFLMACMSVARVKGFSPKRMIDTANRCRHKIAPYATRDAYLDMLEDIYNHGQRGIIALKIEAIKAMRERNPGVKKNKGGQSSEAA